MHERSSHDNGHLVVITGAAGGIGARIARRFSDAGWRLGLLDRPHNLAPLQTAHPGAVSVGVDLSNAEDAVRAVRSILDDAGPIDAVLNLVGGFAMRSALELTDEDLDRQLAVNLRTAVHVTHAVLPGMIERGRGFILGMAARAAVHGGARMAAYAAAKAALVGYFQSLRAELEPKGIGVSLLFPMGTVDTPGNRAAMPDADPATWIDPDELAAAALFLAERGRRGRVPELRVHATG